MKTQSAVLCVLVFAHVLFAQDGRTNATVRGKNATPSFKAVSADLALRDNSTLNCSFKMQTFTFTSSYGQQLNISFANIDRIVLGTGKESSVVSFQNGDQLTGALEVDFLDVDSLLGSHKIRISDIKSIVIKTRMEISSAGLVYWCAFESEESIKNPAVGPKGEYRSGVFVGGKIGKALKTSGASEVASIKFPAGAFRSKGCIEFWARIDELKIWNYDKTKFNLGIREKDISQKVVPR